jgi:chromosomal replication initiator protein DnaA
MFGRRNNDADAPQAAAQKSAPAPRTTPTQVRSEPHPPVHKSLGELLIEEGLLNEEQLQEALKVQQVEGGFIGQIMVRLGFVTQEAVASLLVKQCKIPHLSLMDYDVDPDVLRLVPEEVCRRHHLLPIDKLGRILTVAMVDPLDIDALEDVRKSCPDLRIKPILCNWAHFEQVSQRVFDEAAAEQSGGGGGPEVTMASLGLSARAPATEEASPPPEREAPPPTSRQETPTAVSAPSGASGAEIAQALRESQEAMVHAMRDAVREAVSAAASVRSEAPATPTGPGAAELVEAMRGAMQESMGALAHEIQGLRAVAQPSAEGAAPVQAPGPNSEELATMIRDGVGGVLQEGLAALVVQMRAETGKDHGQGDAPRLEDFAEVVRDSVSGAMQEAVATMVVQMRAMAGKKEGGEGGLNPEALTNALREAQAEVAQNIQAVLETNRQAQADQNARIAEIAEAILQSAQQSALQAASSPREALPVVAPFGGKAPAEQTPERVEEDARIRESLETELPQDALTFDNFLPGKSNAFTFQLGQAVATEPGGEYNPFFLYGSVGVGKTHLTSAIGNAILMNKPDLRVGYVSASLFSQKLQEAVKRHEVDAFRENYCHWDVLILDDIQFMGGRVEAQEEFFHIFNVLHQAGRQIVIASDKSPDRLGLLEKRLISRFASGIVAELKVPEWDTRMQILRQYTKQSGTEVPEEVLSLVAMRVPDDIRKMTGSLRKIVAYANLVGQDMSYELADEILSHLGAEKAA